MTKVLVDGKEVDAEKVEVKKGRIFVTIVDHEKKTKLITDSSLHKIELKQ